MERPELVKDLGMQYPTKTSLKKARYGLYKCVCGTFFKTSINSVKNGNTKSCGCHKNSKTKKHGLSKHPLYIKWSNMKRRCKGKDATSIKYYKDKNIKVCEEWENNFKSFYDWSIQNGYKEELTIDRINGEKGYSPDNCRWVSPHVQSANILKKASLRTNNTSGYRGVWQKKNGRWQAEIRVNKEKILLGIYQNAKDAAIAYDNYIKAHNLVEYNRNFSVINTLKADFSPPSVNHLYKTFCRRGSVRRVMTEKGKIFKKALATLAVANKFKLIETDCTLEYNLYAKKKGRTDLDNTLKAIQDALEGIAYKNDSQIVEIIAKKYKNSNKDGFDIIVRA